MNQHTQHQLLQKFQKLQHQQQLKQPTLELDAAKPAEIAETLQPTAGAIDISPIAQQLEVTAENIEIAEPATEVVETESLASDGEATEALPF